MADPIVFEPGSSHTAVLTMKSSATAAMTLDVVLGLGFVAFEYAASDTKSVSFEAGETKDVALTIVAPAVQAVYGVYVDIYHDPEGFVLGYFDPNPVTVYAAPAIQIIDITWT